MAVGGGEAPGTGARISCDEPADAQRASGVSTPATWPTPSAAAGRRGWRPPPGSISAKTFYAICTPHSGMPSSTTGDTRHRMSYEPPSPGRCSQPDYRRAGGGSRFDRIRRRLAPQPQRRHRRRRPRGGNTDHPHRRHRLLRTGAQFDSAGSGRPAGFRRSAAAGWIPNFFELKEPAPVHPFSPDTKRDHERRRRMGRDRRPAATHGRPARRTLGRRMAAPLAVPRLDGP